MELSIIVYSCWKNRDMWIIFSRLFQKYWSKCPYAVILVTDRFEDEGEQYAFTKVVEIDDTWAKMIKEAIRQAETPYVMLWMDDYLLCDYICSDDIQKQILRAKKFHAANIRLIESPKSNGIYKGHDNIGFYKNGQAYSISTQIGIWDAKFLNKLIRNQWSAWDFERIASMTKRNFHQPLLVALDYVFPYEEGVRRGKWMVSGANLCKRNGIKLDPSTRPIMSSMEMAQIYFRGAILDWNPNFILRVQTLIYKWRRRRVFKKVVVLIVGYIKWIYLIPIGCIHYVIDIVQYMKKIKEEIPPPCKIRGIIPIILDRYKPAGSIDSHYFLQDIYVAKRVMQEKPITHFDVGSRVDGFISHLLAGLEGEVTIIDVRPLLVKIEHLNFIQANATDLKEIEDNSIESLSSLHAVEHFGLGRYGDDIDPKACFTAMRSLQRVVKKNGKLYFSVPIGRINAVYFNSHRIFKAQSILNVFDEMELVEFAYIHNYQIKTIDGKEAIHLIQNKVIPIANYDCGIFVFRKK